MKTNWKKVRNKPDKSIDFSDIPPMDVFDWSQADIVYPEGKTRVNIRLDTDVYKFFKYGGPRYQTKINAILKSYMEHQLRSRSKRPAKK